LTTALAAGLLATLTDLAAGLAAGAATTFVAAVLRAGFAGMACFAAAAFRGAAGLAVLRGRLAAAALTGAETWAVVGAGAGEGAADGLVGYSLGRVDEGMAGSFQERGKWFIQYTSILRSGIDQRIAAALHPASLSQLLALAQS
jgi:hypothetical protein